MDGSTEHLLESTIITCNLQRTNRVIGLDFKLVQRHKTDSEIDESRHIIFSDISTLPGHEFSIDESFQICIWLKTEDGSQFHPNEDEVNSCFDFNVRYRPSGKSPRPAASDSFYGKAVDIAAIFNEPELCCDVGDNEGAVILKRNKAAKPPLGDYEITVTYVESRESFSGLSNVLRKVC